MLGYALNRFAIAYLDNIIVYSKSPEEHLQHLKIVFSKLREADLRLKESKIMLVLSTRSVVPWSHCIG